MGQLILILAVIALFVAFVTALVFPELATVFYEFWTACCGYLTQGTGILWLFVPRTLTVALLNIIILLEVLWYGFQIFVWIYHKIKP